MIILSSDDQHGEPQRPLDFLGYLRNDVAVVSDQLAFAAAGLTLAARQYSQPKDLGRAAISYWRAVHHASTVKVELDWFRQVANGTYPEAASFYESATATMEEGLSTVRDARQALLSSIDGGLLLPLPDVLEAVELSAAVSARNAAKPALTGVPGDATTVVDRSKIDFEMYMQRETGALKQDVAYAIQVGKYALEANGCGQAKVPPCPHGVINGLPEPPNVDDSEAIPRRLLARATIAYWRAAHHLQTASQELAWFKSALDYKRDFQDARLDEALKECDQKLSRTAKVLLKTLGERSVRLTDMLSD